MSHLLSATSVSEQALLSSTDKPSVKIQAGLFHGQSISAPAGSAGIFGLGFGEFSDLQKFFRRTLADNEGSKSASTDSEIVG